MRYINIKSCREEEKDESEMKPTAPKYGTNKSSFPIDCQPKPRHRAKQGLQVGKAGESSLRSDDDDRKRLTVSKIEEKRSSVVESDDRCRTEIVKEMQRLSLQIVDLHSDGLDDQVSKAKE